MGCGHVRVAQQFINRDPGVRKVDQTPAVALESTIPWAG